MNSLRISGGNWATCFKAERSFKVSKIVIVDYGLGNLRSIRRKLLRHGVQAEISSTASDILLADRLIFPGVGHFAAGMAKLRQSDLVGVLSESVLGRQTPIMGICLGMQLFCTFSEEGEAEGLGWIDARSTRFRVDLAASPIKVPHVGWNTVSLPRPSPFFAGIGPEQQFYFTHSYHVECANPEDVVASTDYGYRFTSAVERGNIFGVQFHPEKSHLEGIRVLLNFLGQ